jgi:uncharacterized membrane protein
MKAIGRTILAGALALMPVVLTLWLVSALTIRTDAVMKDLLTPLLPDDTYQPGLGLLVALLLLYVVGLAVNQWAVRAVLRWLDDVMGRIPLVKTLYLAIRDFTRFFPSKDGQKGDLKRVVLVPFGPGQAIGFVTAEDASALGVTDLPSATADPVVAVYLPMSYMVGGYTLFLPKSQLHSTSISVEAAMRLVLMGGVQSAPQLSAFPPPPAPAPPPDA